jgi:hypothetical protein
VPSGEKYPAPDTGIGRAVAAPPLMGTVYSLESVSMKPSRADLNRTALPSGVQP